GDWGFPRKPCPVLASPEDLPPLAHAPRRLAGARERPHVRLVLLREMCREESRERLSQDLRRGISEDAFGTLVEDGNAMRLIDGDDAVLGDFENTRETRVRETL